MFAFLLAVPKPPNPATSSVVPYCVIAPRRCNPIVKYQFILNLGVISKTGYHV